MNMASKTKIEVVARIIEMLTDSFTVVPVRSHAAELAGLSGLPLRDPEFKLSSSRSAEVLQ